MQMAKTCLLGTDNLGEVSQAAWPRSAEPALFDILAQYTYMHAAVYSEGEYTRPSRQHAIKGNIRPTPTRRPKSNW